jgi:hypothetical protein
LSAISDGDWSLGLAGLAAVSLDLLHDVLALQYLAKDNMLSVQPAGFDSGDEAENFDEFKSENYRAYFWRSLTLSESIS